MAFKIRLLFWIGFLACVILGIRWFERTLHKPSVTADDLAVNATTRTPEERNAMWRRLQGDFGTVGPRKEDKAPVVAQIRQLALSGEPRAQLFLAHIYENGDGVERDAAESERWYAMARQNGVQVSVPVAQQMTHPMEPPAPDMTNPTDTHKMLQDIEAAANQGDAMSQNALGWRYTFGIDVPVDLEKARAWYQKSADQGNPTGESQLAYLYGNVPPVDLNRSLEWYHKSADQGHGPAESALGWAYLNGEGVAKDVAEARRWYQRAADHGDATGQYQLGWMNEKLAPVDYAAALRWYEAARAQGHPIATNNIGYFYEHGLGVEQNYSQAFNYYSEAAAKNDPRAAYHLGLLYEKGLGVAQSDAIARQWMEKAAASGEPYAVAWMANHSSGR